MVPLPKIGKPKNSSLTPITIMVVENIGLKKSWALLKVLFDPGSTKTFIHNRVLSFSQFFVHKHVVFKMDVVLLNFLKYLI